LIGFFLLRGFLRGDEDIYVGTAGEGGLCTFAAPHTMPAGSSPKKFFNIAVFLFWI